MHNEKKNLLVFGYGVAIILSFFGVRMWMKHGGGWGVYVLLAAALAFLTIAIFNWQWLKPIYARWMQVARIIGGIITALVLALLFFVIFGIVGIILRLLRKDILDRELDPKRPSYWIKRGKLPFDRKRYTQQF